jgi:hypothetical protein
MSMALSAPLSGGRPRTIQESFSASGTSGVDTSRTTGRCALQEHGDTDAAATAAKLLATWIGEGVLAVAMPAPL